MEPILKVSMQTQTQMLSVNKALESESDCERFRAECHKLYLKKDHKRTIQRNDHKGQVLL